MDTPYLEKESQLDDLVRSQSSTSLGKDCEKHGCLLNERYAIEQG